MVTPRPALIPVLVPALVLGTLLLTGCAGTIPHGPGLASPTTPRTTATPRTTPRTTAGTNVTPPVTAGPTRAAPGSTSASGTQSGFPGNARGYAEAVLAAWASRLTGRLGDLTTTAVRDQILGIAGPPDPRWTYQLCEAAAGSSYCSFVNSDGDTVTLRILDQRVSQAQAVTEVRFDPTRYAAVAGDYVKSFVEAWRTANLNRMRTLSSTAEVAYFTQRPAPGMYSVCAYQTGALQQVRIFNAGGLNEVITLAPASLGGKHAIFAHLDPAPVPPACA